MPSIVAYRKASDRYTTHSLDAPEGSVELCEIDGLIYVSVPDSASLAVQPKAISASVKAVKMTPPLRDAIKAASPHVQLIAQRMIEQIRAAYSIDDELYLARIGVGAAMGMYVPSSDELQEMTVFGEFVEGVRQWGRDERAKLGL